MKLIECMEKFLLHSFLVGKELNIVNQKNVGISVFFVKFVNAALVIDSIDKLAAENLTCNVDDIFLGVIFAYFVSNCGNKVSFSKS